MKERRIRWVGHVTHFRREEKYRVVGGKLEGERLCER